MSAGGGELRDVGGRDNLCERPTEQLARALVYQPALGVEAHRGVPDEELGKVSNRSRS